ncbi:MAG: energy transducer TonB [Bdellovibrionales bacterium]
MTTDTFDESRIFKKSLQYSLAAHIFIFLFFTLKAFIIPSEKIDYSTAVRVDIVALPDKLSPDAQLAPKVEPAKNLDSAEVKPKIETPPKPQVKTEKKAEPDTVSFKKSKSKQQEALDRLKKMSALDKIRNEVETSKKRAQALEQISQVKGNVLSAGSSLSGLNKLQHDEYVSILDQHIKQNWTKPKWIEKELRARVRVKIDSDGQILSRELTLSSGDPIYDETVLNTVDSSAPFPRPPEKFVEIVAARGILIGFPD